MAAPQLLSIQRPPDRGTPEGGHMILIGADAKEKFMQKLEADVGVS
jgi:hypothetical protein